MTLQKAQSGQPWTPPSATAHNAMVDAAIFVKQQGRIGGGALGVTAARGTVVLVKNTTDNDLDYYDIRVLDDLVISPSDNLMEFKSRPPVFNLAAITSQNKSKAPAVLLQPLKKDKIGKALISGTTPVKIKVSSEDNEYAVLDETDSVISASSGIFRILWKQDGTGTGKWALLQFPAGGGDTYKGFFKVINTSSDTTQKVTILDGNNADASNCGIAVIVNSQRNIAKAELTVTATGYVILETTYNETTNAINASELKFITAATFYANTKSIVLIARVFVEDSKIAGIIQEQHGLIVSDIKDEC